MDPSPIYIGFTHDRPIIAVPTPKKGDRVRSTKDVSTIKAGALGTVIGKLDDEYLQVRFDVHTYSHRDHYHGCNIDSLVVVPQETKPLFKKGDRVRWTNPPTSNYGGEEKWIGTAIEDCDGVDVFVSVRYDAYKYCSPTDKHNTSVDQLVSDPTPAPLPEGWRKAKESECHGFICCATSGCQNNGKEKHWHVRVHDIAVAGCSSDCIPKITIRDEIEKINRERTSPEKNMETKIAIGQVWKQKVGGYIVEIVAINGTSVDAKVMDPAITQDKVGDVRKNFGNVGSGGEVKWHGWDIIQTTQEETMEAKVGQIWFDERRGWKVQITAINGLDRGSVSARQIGDHNGYTDGYHHSSFCNPSKNDYKMVQDVPKVGDKVRHQASGLDATLGIGKIINVGTDGIAEIRFEKYKYTNVSQTHSYWLKDLICLEKEGKNMSNDKEMKADGFVDMFKSDAKDALWRSGATQMTNAVRSGILSMLKDKSGFDDGKLAIAKEIMETEIGAILIRAALGYGLTYMPHVGQDPRAQRLAKELRVGAMNSAMDEVVGGAVEYLLPAITTAISALPPIEEAVPNVLKGAKKRRVADGPSPADEEEETETAEPKTATA